MYNSPTPPPPRQGVNDARYVPKLYASSGIAISKCIEGGSMKLATLVDYYIIHVYMCVCNHECISV